jgi:hypothetical protein
MERPLISKDKVDPALEHHATNTKGLEKIEL